MNMMSSIAKIASPTLPMTDFAYEAECKVALGPPLLSLLEAAETAGWDRRKAAYTLMFLAAQQLSASGGG
jgi:hypothetical protein